MTPPRTAPRRISRARGRLLSAAWAGLAVATLAAPLAGARGRGSAGQKFSLKRALGEILPQVNRGVLRVEAPLKATPDGKQLRLPIIEGCEAAQLSVRPDTRAKVSARVLRAPNGGRKVRVRLSFSRGLVLHNGLELQGEIVEQKKAKVGLSQRVLGRVGAALPKSVRPTELKSLILEYGVDAQGNELGGTLSCRVNVGGIGKLIGGAKEVVRGESTWDVKGIKLPQSPISNQLIEAVVGRFLQGGVSGKLMVEPRSGLSRMFGLSGAGAGRAGRRKGPWVEVAFDERTRIEPRGKGLVVSAPAGGGTLIVGEGTPRLDGRQPRVRAELSDPLSVTVDPTARRPVSAATPIVISGGGSVKLPASLSDLLPMVSGGQLQVKAKLAQTARPLRLAMLDGLPARVSIRRGTEAEFTAKIETRPGGGRRETMTVRFAGNPLRLHDGLEMLNEVSSQKRAQVPAAQSVLGRLGSKLPERWRPTEIRSLSFSYEVDAAGKDVGGTLSCQAEVGGVGRGIGAIKRGLTGAPGWQIRDVKLTRSPTPRALVADVVGQFMQSSISGTLTLAPGGAVGRMLGLAAGPKTKVELKLGEQAQLRRQGDDLVIRAPRGGASVVVGQPR